MFRLLTSVLALNVLVSAIPHATYSSFGNSTKPIEPTSKYNRTVVYNWHIGWVTAAPAGVERPLIGINGQWPCPSLDVDVGDRVIVNVHNGLGNQSTSLHWHGIHQRGTNHMDGAIPATQCPIPPGNNFTYEWIADQPGTYWYHSHDSAQYPDGLWGPLIVHDPDPPFEYDEEITISFSDFYNEQMPELIHTYQSHSGEAADGTPLPSGGALINGAKNVSIPVKPNKTYLVHFICPAAYSGHGFIIKDHPGTTVEVDGTYVQPVNANAGGNLTRLAPGQRQAMLIKTKNDTSQNYAIFNTMDVNMLFINKGIIPPPSDYNTNVTGWLVYDEEKPLPDPPVYYSLSNANFFEDLDYVPLDLEAPLEPVAHRFTLNTKAANLSGISRFEIDNYTFLGTNVPSLYSALSLPDYASNVAIYGDTNPIVVGYNDIVEIVINNLNGNLHPWHLHGHQFQVLERTLPNVNGGVWPGYYSGVHSAPAKRDTVMLQDYGYAVLRFKADNPGVWLLHCHIEFHVPSGLTATVIEAPERISEKVPRDHIEACKAYPMPYKGNAAGNVDSPFNLTGAPDAVPQNTWGSLYPASAGAVFRKRAMEVRKRWF